MHIVFCTHRAGKLLQLRSFWSTADQEQMQIVVQELDNLEGPDGILKALLRKKRPGTKHPASIRADSQGTAKQLPGLRSGRRKDPRRGTHRRNRRPCQAPRCVLRREDEVIRWQAAVTACLCRYAPRTG